jgi:hypothetical protein
MRAAAELEIFIQTLLSFPESDVAELLPKAMNNMQFSEVLKLWKARIIDPEKLKGKKNVLGEQYDKITSLLNFRAGMVHGMWDYNHQEPFRIKTIRIKGKELVTVEFPPESLLDFMMTLQEINFKIRNPRGIGDYAKTVAKRGSWMSRHFIARARGDPRADELLPGFIGEAPRKTEAKK